MSGTVSARSFFEKPVKMFPMTKSPLLYLLISAGFYSHAASAEPSQISCRFLDVIGSNKTDEIQPMMDEVAEQWLSESRNTASKSLINLSKQDRFIGGNIYRLTDLGDDLTEDLVLLRLEKGEVHGLLLRYSWAPDGRRLDGLDYKQNVEQLGPLALSGQPQLVVCDQ